MITIQPLTQSTIDAAIALANTVFPDDVLLPTGPGVAFHASLNSNGYEEFIKIKHIKDLQFFVAIDTETNKVIGTTGINHLLTDPSDFAWLGWYCVDPSYRGKGIGKMLLTWTIDKAREQGNNYVRLWTTTEPSLATAQILFDKLGFVTTSEEKENNTTIVYKELKL